MQHATAVDVAKLEHFLGQVVSDLGATFNAELAERAGTEERYVRERLGAQAAGGYVTYDPDGATYTLPPEQAMALADPDSSVFMPRASRDQEVGLALGAQAGEARLTEVLKETGFGRVRRVTGTPLDLVPEARP